MRKFLYDLRQRFYGPPFDPLKAPVLVELLEAQRRSEEAAQRRAESGQWRSKREKRAALLLEDRRFFG